MDIMSGNGKVFYKVVLKNCTTKYKIARKSKIWYASLWKLSSLWKNFVGSPEGSGYISELSFSVEIRLDKFLARSVKSFTASVVANSRRDVQKNA